MSRKRFCDFLADPDSRSFNRFTLSILGAGSYEGEDWDREELLLPWVQEQLLVAVAEAAKQPITLVVLSGSAIDLSWALASPKVGAILQVRKTSCGAKFMLNTEDLPRQARDKHRGKVEKRGAFCSRGTVVRLVAKQLHASYQERYQNAFFAPFYTKHDHFTKTGSGLT